MLPGSEPGNRRHRLGVRRALFLEQLGQQEREIDRLLGIEPRIADRVIAVVEIGFRDGAGAAGAFGDVLPGHLQMHAAGIGAFGLMHFEEAAHLLQDQVERPGLVAGRRGDGVAVHRVARPQHDPALALHRAHQRRQMLADLFGAEAADQRQTARLVVRIENVDQPQQIVRLERRPAFQADADS